MCNKRLNLISLCTRWAGVLSTYTMFVLIINNETKLCLLLPMVAKFEFWFPDVVFAILL